MELNASIVRCPACTKRNRVPTVAEGRPRCGHCQANLPWLVEADDLTFAGQSDTELLALVDLWAPWCGPCRMVAPILEKLAVTYAGRLKVIKVNVDESPRLATRFRAQSIPMLVFLREGDIIDTIIGAQPEHVLSRKVDELLAG